MVSFAISVVHLVFKIQQKTAVYYYEGFTQFSKKNGCLAASELFHMFTQPIKVSYIPLHVLRAQMFEKCHL